MLGPRLLLLLSYGGALLGTGEWGPTGHTLGVDRSPQRVPCCLMDWARVVLASRQLMDDRPLPAL